MDRATAREILARCHVPADVDFHTLRSEQVEALVAEGRARRYRKPANAPGSYGRMFCQALQRAATRREV